MPDPGLNDSALEKLLLRQRDRWEQGNPWPLQAILVEYPELGTQKEVLLDLVNNEILLRSEAGQAPVVGEYVEVFPHLRADIEQIFAIHEMIEGDEPTRGYDNQATKPHVVKADAKAPPTLPHYSLLNILGQGGMGIVYKAFDQRLKRHVAVKMVRGALGADDRKRFQREAEAVAKLDHPNIVHIYEVGEHDQQPFFALEYVDSGSLSKLIAGKPQAWAFCAQMIETLGRAIHHAHGHGIIHRDLKPANILLHQLREEKSQGTSMSQSLFLVRIDQKAYVPKIADFGLAKLLREDQAQSQSHAIVGTPSYMAPEQVTTSSVGPATDVYALGAVLYEMIVGRPPFLGQTMIDTLEQVKNDAPVPPTRLQPKCPRDLETICLKCLAKTPEKRYASGEELAEDLGRFLRQEPIQARPAGKIELVWLWCKRKPAIAGLIAFILLIAAVGFPVMTSLWLRAERREAEHYQMFYASRIPLAQNAWERGEIPRMRSLLDSLQKPPAGQPDRRGFEWFYLNGLLQKHVDEGPGSGCLAVSADGRWLATGTVGSDVAVFDARNLKAPPRLLTGHVDKVTSLAFDPLGPRLLSGSEDGTARFWDVETGTQLFLLDPGEGSQVTSVAVSRKGSLAVARTEKTAGDLFVYRIRLWDLDPATKTSYVTRLSFDSHKQMIRQVAFNPKGNRLASADEDRRMILWNLATGSELRSWSLTQSAKSIAFHPTKPLLASAGWDGVLRLWNVDDKSASAEPINVYQQRSLPLNHVVFSADGLTLATAGEDGALNVWDVYEKPATGLTPRCTYRVGDPQFRLAFAGLDRIVGLGKNDRLSVWNAAEDPEAEVHTDPTPINHLLRADNDNWVLMHPQAIAVWSGTPRMQTRLWPLADLRETLAVCLLDGSLLALSAEDETFIRIFDFAQGKEIARFAGHEKPVAALAYHRERKILASGSGDLSIRLWNLEGRVLHVLSGHEQDVNDLAFSNDGWLASASEDRSVRLWDLSGQLRHTFVVDEPAVRVAFHPREPIVAAGLMNGSVQLWNPNTGKHLVSLPAHGKAVKSLAFGPDGRLLASGSADGRIKIWDVPTRQELLELAAHSLGVSDVLWHPQGEMLLSAGKSPPLREDRQNSRIERIEIRVWHAPRADGK